MYYLFSLYKNVLEWFAELSLCSKWDISHLDLKGTSEWKQSWLPYCCSESKCSKLATSKGLSEWRNSKGTIDGHFGSQQSFAQGYWLVTHPAFSSDGLKHNPSKLSLQRVKTLKGLEHRDGMQRVCVQGIVVIQSDTAIYWSGMQNTMWMGIVSTTFVICLLNRFKKAKISFILFFCVNIF